ncbi:MAG: DUF177 domain-containing protein [Candidatus Omnitrophica bacterium]|nr:DUF177 domain-containing protein [Candidatus Omnitrophota bacterium]
MKIAVDKIPAEGLELTEQIDPGRISSDLKGQGVDFVKSVDVKARFTKSGNEVFVDINLAVPCEYTCARCLVKVQNIFKKDFNMNYEVKPGDILEVDEDIRQEMILDSPMKFVCNADCKGLCPNCGQNLNVAKCDCGKDVGPIKNRPLG